MAEMMKSLIGPLMTEFGRTISRQLDTKLQAIRSEFPGAPAPNQSSVDRVMTFQNTLPPFDVANPWRIAVTCVTSGDNVTVEGLGTRPIADFEKHPKDATWPNCYIRLKPEASVREDKIPRESVIFPHAKAQAYIVSLAKKTAATNTKVSPKGSDLTMYLTSPAQPNPFTTKVLRAFMDHVRQGTTMSALKEEEPTSLFFPADSSEWKAVHTTFTTGKLEPHIASLQFRDNLYKLPDSLIKIEHESRIRLQRSIHSCTLLETGLLQDPRNDLLKVVLKSLLTTLRTDIAAFHTARTNCRRSILTYAHNKFEADKLIKANIWGPKLFDEESVQEILESVSKTNTTLKARLGIYTSFKRKFSEVGGPQPKNTAYKRMRANNKNWPNVPTCLMSQWLTLQKARPSSSNPQGTQSPATPSKTFRAKPHNQGQGRGGRGGGGDRGRGRSAGRSRGNGGGRVRRNSRGRGAQSKGN